MLTASIDRFGFGGASRHVMNDSATNDELMSDELICTSSISKAFGVVQALSGVSISVRRGEIVALAGENGSGKSTFAKILAGSIAQDSGAVTLNGREVHFARPRQALDAGIALVSQEPSVVPNMSVAENVLLPTVQQATQRFRRRALEARALPFLQRVGLNVDPSQPFHTLRHGERELVEVAKALALAPQLLILDEATTRLADPERLFRVIEGLVAEGMSAIVITHRLREIRRLAHRAFVLRDGHLVAELGQADLTDERISSAMVGRELSQFFHKREVPVADSVLTVNALVTDRSPEPISLAVGAGEIVGIAGLVGSGRSELLETIAGLRRPKRGAVLVDGKPVRPGSTRSAMTAGLSLVPEDRLTQGLVRNATIKANLSLSSHRALARTDDRSERSRARDVVSRFSVRCAGIDASVSSLSGGNAQKVVLARAVCQLPKVLLLDEPTRGVDVGAKEEIYSIIGDMVERRMGVLMASSDLLELLGLCDRIVVLHDGAVAGELDRAHATEETITLMSTGGQRP